LGVRGQMDVQINMRPLIRAFQMMKSKKAKGNDGERRKNERINVGT
jgi:hypothetical protein